MRFTLGSDEPALLERHLEGIDHLFHLAAEKHNQSKHDPDAILRANVLGTHALFAAAARCGVKKTVFASSLYSYGRLAGPPCSETDLPLPTTVYGISKLCGERLLAHATSQPPMRGDSLRFFFVYGPRQFAGMGYRSVIVKNFERMRAGQPPIIFGDGSQRLDYVYVDDVVEATLRCMESPGSGRVLNVGSGRRNLDRGADGGDAAGGGLERATAARAAGLDRGKLAGREHRRDPHGARLAAPRHARAGAARDVERAERRRRPVKLLLSVVAPCFNEAQNLAELTERLNRTFERKGIAGEIILVNDGSRDDTGAVIDALARQHPNVVAIHHAVNRGIEAGWRSGLQAARGIYVCFIDADLQHLPEDVYRLLREIQHSHVDLVQGYRSSVGRLKDSRYILSKGLNFLLEHPVRDESARQQVRLRDLPQGGARGHPPAPLPLPILPDVHHRLRDRGRATRRARSRPCSRAGCSASRSCPGSPCARCCGPSSTS